MVNNLLHYSCYKALTCFDANEPSSAGSYTVPAKLRKRLNEESSDIFKILRMFGCWNLKL
jgi:hypothetical protein